MIEDTDCTDTHGTKSETPETDAITALTRDERIGWPITAKCYADRLIDIVRKLQRERNEARKSQPINTHVRLFDLVRIQRGELHRSGLITDEEYAWLCSSEMATSTTGGSPSPRRLEDYDQLRVRLVELEQWKAEQVAVESQWDPQMVANLLGIGLGESIRSKIQPKIEELVSHIADLEKDMDILLRLAHAAIYDGSNGPKFHAIEMILP